MSIGVQVWSTTASNNSTADTNINWQEGMAPSQVNDSARAEMASMAKFRDDNNGSIVTGGTTLAYTATSNQVEAALTSGYTICVQFHATNDVGATLAVDSLAAKPLQITAGTNVLGGEFTSGNNYRFTYSTTGTGQWILNDYVPGVTNAIVDSAVTYAKIQIPGASKLLGNPTTSTSTNYQEITLGTNLSFSGTVLNSGNNTPKISVLSSTTAATWDSTTKGGNFPLYIKVRMVGGGGGGGAQTTNDGSAGSDTSFDSWTAIHGNGGVHGNSGAATGGAGGTGGASGTGTVITRIDGGAGNPQTSGNAGAGSGPSGGQGGATPFGGAGTGGIGSAIGNNAAANSGSGGGGSGGAVSTNSGGGGGAGEFVEFIITSPSTSYSYTVGGKGPGGTAGTHAGGDGAAGRIEVISYWQ